MTTNVRWRGQRSRGASSRGQQIDIQGNQQINMDIDDDGGEHETKTDVAKATD
jgi:hypothetical protein